MINSIYYLPVESEMVFDAANERDNHLLIIFIKYLYLKFRSTHRTTNKGILNYQ